jgi:hypothetical protein
MFIEKDIHPVLRTPLKRGIDERIPFFCRILSFPDGKAAKSIKKAHEIMG